MITDDTNPGWRDQLGILDAGPIVRTPRYEVWRAPRAAGGQGIRCLTCLHFSSHPQDVANRYCAACHRFHDDQPPEATPCR